MGKGLKAIKKAENAMAVEDGSGADLKKAKNANKVKLLTKLRAKRIQKQAKKVKPSKAARRGQPTAMEIERRKQEARRVRTQIKKRLRNKKKIKLEPQLLKDFNERFETESKKFLDSSSLSKGQKKRLKRKVIKIDQISEN